MLHFGQTHLFLRVQHSCDEINSPAPSFCRTPLSPPPLCHQHSTVRAHDGFERPSYADGRHQCGIPVACFSKNANLLRCARISSVRVFELRDADVFSARRKGSVISTTIHTTVAAHSVKRVNKIIDSTKDIQHTTRSMQKVAVTAQQEKQQQITRDWPTLGQQQSQVDSAATLAATGQLKRDKCCGGSKTDDDADEGKDDTDALAGRDKPL